MIVKGKTTQKGYTDALRGSVDYESIQTVLASKLARQGIHPDNVVLAIAGLGITLGLFAKSIDLLAGNGSSEEALDAMCQMAVQAYRAGAITN